MKKDTTDPTSDCEEENNLNEEDPDQDLTLEQVNLDDAEEVFESISTQIDQLHSVLDELEKKNELIQAQMLELLKCNREARQQFEQEKARAS